MASNPNVLNVVLKQFEKAKKFKKEVVMKNKTFYITLVLTGILIISGYTNFRLYQVNAKQRDSLPYLLKGESITYFKMLDGSARTIDKSTLTGKRPSLIFIFSRPCSPCNKNIVYWKKMATLLGDKVNVYGIVLADASHAFNFSETAKLNFKIYVPENISTFSDALRIKMNLSQTIIYHNNSVLNLKLGDLNGQEATDFIKMVKRLT
jgi:peroxiredoxin